MEHWDAIRRRVSEGLLGSCTEEQVSHILSGRFSRDPLGWSEEGRGGAVKTADLSEKQRKDRSFGF